MHRLSSAVRRTTVTSPPPSTTPDVPVVLLSGTHFRDPSISISGHDANFRQLEELVTSMRARLKTVRVKPGDDEVREEQLDEAFSLFVKIGDQCAALCRALVVDGGRERRGHGRGGSTASTASTASTTGPRPAVARRVTVAGSSSSAGPETLGDQDVAATEGLTGRPVNTAWLAAVREWKACLEELAADLKAYLTNTYKRHEQSASSEIVDALFADRKSRSQVVSGWMKNLGANKRMQGQSGVWSKWESQFQNYEQTARSLAELTSLLQPLDSGIPPDRAVTETIIAPRGDAILEFANAAAMDSQPVLRFRVSSHVLAETSPAFARLFARMPPCPDGSRVSVYRMPQLELDKESSLTILLHAAHMHNDRVPREVSFEQFVAIAETSLRYKCTSPLELVVEHRWLPQWVHKATDAMPDGLVVISFAFGLRRLFTRVTKTAILNLVDERELAGKNWPEGIKERIWAVRCAKMAQVYASCARAVEEYLRPPRVADGEMGGRASPDAMDGVVGRGSQPATPVGSPPRPVSGYATAMSPSRPSIFAHGNTSTASLFSPTAPSPRLFSSTPRCPKGSHWCDATNLGWLMLVYNELQILSTFLNPATVCQSQAATAPPARSLAQIVDALRMMASPPPHPDHRSSSVCDPAPAFRTAINDVYNSVAGLTLYEIDGTRHGWALSRHRMDQPQPMLRIGAVADRLATTERAEQNNVDSLITAMGDLGLAEGVSRAMTDAMSDLGLDEEGSRAMPPVSLAEEVFRDEGACLRILRAVDTASGIHAAAMVNRSVYAVYKQHEPELMRNVAMAERGKTVQRPVRGQRHLADGFADNRADDATEPPTYLQSHASIGANTALRGLTGDDEDQPLTDGPPSTTGEDYVSVDADNDSSTEAGVSAFSESSSGTPVRTVSPLPSYPTLSPVSTHRANPFFKMTEEEARQILWPEPPPALLPQLSTPDVRAFSAVSHVIEDVKFGGSDIRVEDKSLVTVGNKQLREDMDRRIGLI